MTRKPMVSCPTFVTSGYLGEWGIRYRHGVRSRYTRPSAIVGHILVLIAALVCLRLGWWQWSVFGATGGDGQNLGYALLWPVFAGSFIYMWLRFLHLEASREAAGDEYDELLAEADPGNLGDPSDGIEAGTNEAGREGTDADAPPRQRIQSPGATIADARTVGMGFIDTDDEDDPELAAYNRALAQLAEEDKRRGR